MTEDGVLSSFALSDRATTTPPDGAGPARVTVQVVLANEIKLVELQASIESTGAARFNTFCHVQPRPNESIDRYGRYYTKI